MKTCFTHKTWNCDFGQFGIASVDTGDISSGKSSRNTVSHKFIEVVQLREPENIYIKSVSMSD